MKTLILSVLLLLVGVVTKAGVLIVYSQLNNGNCRISVQYASPGSNVYSTVSFVDVPGPCVRQPGPYSEVIQVDPRSELGKAILKADARADLNRITAVNEAGFNEMVKKQHVSIRRTDFQK